MYHSKALEAAFKEREIAVLDMIKKAIPEFREIGIFGSYARGDYKATSDIDFVVIVDERPSRYITGELRCDADILHAEIVFVTPGYFENDESLFARNMRRDYRRLS